jgi:hypothetical protein
MLQEKAAPQTILVPPMALTTKAFFNRLNNHKSCKSGELNWSTSLLAGWSFLNPVNNHTALSGTTLSAGLMIRSTMVASASKAAFFSL